MLGKGIGDAVRVVTPNGDEAFEVVDIRYMATEENSVHASS
jgi:transcription elongation factor GreB